MTTSDISTVLLVENEPLIALDLEGMLLSAGAASVHHVMSTQDALDWLRNNRPDLSILDVFVQDGASTPVAEHLRAQGVPFVVHSGHTRQGSEYGASFADAVWLSKPCTEHDLSAAIQQALRLPL